MSFNYSLCIRKFQNQLLYEIVEITVLLLFKRPFHVMSRVMRICEIFFKPLLIDVLVNIFFDHFITKSRSIVERRRKTGCHVL